LCINEKIQVEKKTRLFRSLDVIDSFRDYTYHNRRANKVINFVFVVYHVTIVAIVYMGC